MLKSKKLKVGNKLIEGGKVYKVYKISFEKNNGKKERTIHFRPHYKENNDDSLICSIPECNLEYTGIRRPIKKTEMKRIIKFLSKRSNNKYEADVISAKSILSSNDVRKTAKVVKMFWKEKGNKEVNFTKTKKDILERAINQMVEEVALVIGVSLDNARKKIDLALDR